MAKNELAKKKESIAAIWEDRIPDLLSQNVRIQKKALDTIEAKIGDANAYQAALVYGILHDKCQLIVGGKKDGEGGVNSFNMFFGADIPENKQMELMEKVLRRAKMPSEEVEEVEVVSTSEVSKDEAEE